MSKATEKLLVEAKAAVVDNEELTILIESLEDVGDTANGNSPEYKDLKNAMAEIAKVKKPESNEGDEGNEGDDSGTPETTAKGLAQSDIESLIDTAEELAKEYETITPFISKLEALGLKNITINTPEYIELRAIVQSFSAPKTPEVSQKKTVKFKKLIKNPVAIGFETYREDEFTLTEAEAKQNEDQIKRSIKLKMIEKV